MRKVRAHLPNPARTCQESIVIMPAVFCRPSGGTCNEFRYPKAAESLTASGWLRINCQPSNLEVPGRKQGQIPAMFVCLVVLNNHDHSQLFSANDFLIVLYLVYLCVCLSTCLSVCLTACCLSVCLLIYLVYITCEYICFCVCKCMYVCACGGQRLMSGVSPPYV